jgi:CHAD domain-containing protein
MATTARRPDASTDQPRGPVAVAEVERKFDIGPDFALPDLSGLPGVATVAEPVVQTLDATYFDSADLRLVANKITLRRRTGGDDAGWHLKRPRGGERSELHAPLGRSTRAVPAVLRTPVEVHLRGAELEPVIRLQTARTVHRLLDDSGAVLAEVAEDHVTASVPGARKGPARASAANGTKPADAGPTDTGQQDLGPGGSRWQELEVELVRGDLDLLSAVVERVRAAGATPSPSASKLARALGDRLPRRPDRPEGVEPGSAGAVLLDHLVEQVGKLRTQDPLVREDRPDAVHQMRVATRRLRSALATFRPLLDRTVTDPIREELKWLGGVLGGARDAEVIRDHLQDLVRAEPPELVLGPVAGRIATAMGARYRTAHDAALTELNGPRYLTLLDGLDRLVTRPPLVADAAGDPDDLLLPLVARTFTRMRTLVKQARHEPDPTRHDELLHEVRKAAKRARYAGESVAPRYGPKASGWAARMEAIQEALGAHQDTVVIRAELVGLAHEAHQHGELTFTYGRLHALEERRASETEGLFDQAWRKTEPARLHRWLQR